MCPFIADAQHAFRAPVCTAWVLCCLAVGMCALACFLISCVSTHSKLCKVERRLPCYYVFKLAEDSNGFALLLFTTNIVRLCVGLFRQEVDIRYVNLIFVCVFAEGAHLCKLSSWLLPPMLSLTLIHLFLLSPSIQLHFSLYVRIMICAFSSIILHTCKENNDIVIKRESLPLPFWVSFLLMWAWWFCCDNGVVVLNYIRVKSILNRFH